MNKLKNWTLLLYFALSLIYLELVFRFATVGGYIFAGDFFIAAFFASMLAVVFFLLCTAFSPRVNRVLAVAVLVLMSTLFASQLVYYQIFTTFYTVYSAANASQVFQFWREALLGIVSRPVILLLLFLPVIAAIVLRRRLNFAPTTWAWRGILVVAVLMFYGGGVAAVHAGDKGPASAYALYYQRPVPRQSVERLGLITTMRLDVQRLLFGWNASIQPPPDDAPAWVPVPEEEDKPVEYNTLNIDFAALAESEEDEEIRILHRYFASLKPSAKNAYTGKYQGYNLILITAEGFSHLAVREDITPTLYRMVQEGYKFTNFYTPLWEVSTSDGEYVACTGLIPKSGVWSFKESAKNYMPLVMGNQLRRLGYQTVAYHNHTYTYYRRHLSHPNMGYEYKGIGNGLKMADAWPRSDLEMMQKTVPEYIGDHQFHAYYMTVSGHLHYNFFGNQMAMKNRKLVEHLPYSTAAKAYLATQIELDRALEYLLEQLEAAGVADRTLIAISSDHYPYGLEKSAIEELAGHPIDNNFDLYRNAFILWTKGMEPITIDEPCSSLDIIPTLSNLLGLEFDSRLLMGRDIHSDAPPLVIFADGSFITDKGRYDVNTGKFYGAPGQTVEPGYVEEMCAVVAAKFYASAKILETDYYARVIPR
ncbi:MAG: sulfatase-like hydrolase/transferase [Firmicutes bacterium]|nr:sulfatase-like hydrolase/transferase [Bacillota bacterium]HOB34319.1 sulfatase-like hydrolase/transferase [Bacillota bacterium]HPZ90674.1 sulfatase-like hydrolase/transferase [Bacillota bacterium]HQE01530.1 sulfatase-like hydrolase/transferase [Bacillota bacterium]